MPILSPLQKTAVEFKQWRENKSSAGERTPLSLRKKAISLTKQCSVTQVTQTLGLSGSVLKRWREDLSDEDKDIPDPAPTSSFVSLPKRAAQESGIKRIVMSFDDDGTIELTGDISSRLALVITQAIWRENALRDNPEVA